LSESCLLEAKAESCLKQAELFFLEASRILLALNQAETCLLEPSKQKNCLLLI